MKFLWLAFDYLQFAWLIGLTALSPQVRRAAAQVAARWQRRPAR